MDKIFINGLELFAYHGVNPEEKTDGQMFVLDITCYLPLVRPCATDCVDDTVSYAKILKTARRAFLAEKYDLLERAADAVIQAIFADFQPITQVTVLLKKPQAPIRADFSWVGVELTRTRNDYEGSVSD